MAEVEEYQLETKKELNTRISDKDITQLLEKCCTYGPYQRRMFIYLFSTRIFTAISSMTLIFITANVPFLCYPPTFNVSAKPPNLTENEYLHMFQPDGDQCSVYNNTITETYYIPSPSNVSKLRCSYGRKFLTENFSTIISEFDLVCEKKWLRSTLQSVYFVGYLLGSFIFGILSDRFGRKKIFFIANTCIVVCGLGKIFVPSLPILMILHCIQASGYIGNLINMYSLTLEFTSANNRTLINFGFMCMNPCMTILLPGLAYAIPDWHYLELAVCLLPIINFFFWNCISESPRWLIGRKRFAEAQALLLKMMKKNKMDYQEVFHMFTNNEKSSHENSFQENTRVKRKSPKEKSYSFIDLFKTFQLAMITLNICFCWFVIGMLYYGVTINSVDMAGNRYVNSLLMIAVEFPSLLCSYYLCTRFGHRKPICFFLMFSGLNCIVSNFVSEGSFWFPLILVLLGKFGISAAFNLIYLLSAETFPTVVRANGLGIASMSARIGGICAPFILQLSLYFKWLPLCIYGICSVISGLLLLLLPETKGRDLPETFEDLKNSKT